jgi:hypothetical protein
MTDLVDLPCPHPRQQFPTKEEVLRLKPLIERLNKDTYLLQVEVNRLQTQLESLQRKRANYASYISPLRRLPTEILREIISTCIDQGIDILTIAGLNARFRDAALGMATLWSKISLRPGQIDLEDDEEYRKRCFYCSRDKGMRICRHYYGSEEVSLLSCNPLLLLTDLQGGIKCATMEQLKIVLTRANSLPLKLRIEWPVETATLELLASLGHPIRSLTFSNRSLDRIMFHYFRDFNLAMLQELRFEDFSWHGAEMILDWASQSNHSLINLDLWRVSNALNILGHPLSQQVIEMRVRLGQHALF